MRIVGIDPGSRFCGFGAVEAGASGRLFHREHGVIALQAEGSIDRRLARLHLELSEALARHRPDLVVIEDVFHAQNARSALVLGQARGVALLAAAQSSATVKSYAPAMIKRAVAGSGKAEKEQVGRMVCTLLGLEIVARHDALDALAAAICGALRAGPAAQAAPAPGPVASGKPRSASAGGPLRGTASPEFAAWSAASKRSRR